MSPLLSFVWRRRQQQQQNSPAGRNNAISSTITENKSSAEVAGIRNDNSKRMTTNNSSSINNRFTIEKEMSLSMEKNTPNTGPPIQTLTSCSSSEEESTNETVPNARRDTNHRNHSNSTDKNHQEHMSTRSSAMNASVAVTPDGFKPRRSICDIRNELIQFRDDHCHHHRGSAASSVTSRHRNEHSSSTTQVKLNNGGRRSTNATITNTATPVQVILNENNNCRAIVPVSAMRQEHQHGIYRSGHGEQSNPTLVSQIPQPNINYLMNQESNYSSGLAVLPPLPIRSWSTEGNTTPATNASSGQHNYGSSTGRVSFATNGSATTTTTMQPMTPSAESPNFEPGRTLTAVGNLIVAMEHNMQLDPPGTTPLQDMSHHYTQQDDNTWEYSPQEQNVETMFSPLLLHNRPSLIDSNVHNRSIQKSTKSHRSTSSISQLPMIAEQVTKSSNLSMPTTTCNASFHDIGDGAKSFKNNSRHIRSASLLVPSGPPYDGTAPTSTKKQLMVTHHSSNSTIVPLMRYDSNEDNGSYSEEKRQNGYSWTVTSTPSQSSSSSTGSKTASKKTITSTSNSIVVIDSDHLLLAQQTDPNIGQFRSCANSTDRSIQLRKAKSQNRVKEELIISALERLQDDLQLVSDVEGLLQVGNSHIIGRNNTTPNMNQMRHMQLPSQSSMYDWFVSTPMDKEGILTGFTDVTRYAILDKIDFLIHDYIDMNSPDLVETLPHPSLREALVFCTLLVKMAIPEAEKEDSSLQGTEEVGHWHFTSGLREVIGLPSLDGSATPTRERGGGDASFFSLPDDDLHDNCDTPMTSNVSIGASTLTSIVRGDQHGVSRPAFGTSIALQQQQQKQYNGLYLRQAIQLFTTGIQKMSMACHQLLELKGRSLNPSNLLQVAAMIQKSYLQLLSMNQNDLKSIVDAFEFEICANSFIENDENEGEEICEITDDDEDPPEIHPVNSVDSPILFAETIGFGILNTGSHHDDTSFDISYDETGSSNNIESQQQPTVQQSSDGHDNNTAYPIPLLPPVPSHANDNHQQYVNYPAQTQRTPKANPVLTLDTFFEKSNHYSNNMIPIQNHYDNDNHSLTSFTTASYKSIRLEI